MGRRIPDLDVRVQGLLLVALALVDWLAVRRFIAVLDPLGGWAAGLIAVVAALAWVRVGGVARLRHPAGRRDWALAAAPGLLRAVAALVAVVAAREVPRFVFYPDWGVYPMTQGQQIASLVVLGLRTGVLVAGARRLLLGELRLSGPTARLLVALPLLSPLMLGWLLRFDKVGWLLWGDLGGASPLWGLCAGLLGLLLGWLAGRPGPRITAPESSWIVENDHQQVVLSLPSQGPARLRRLERLGMLATVLVAVAVGLPHGYGHFAHPFHPLLSPVLEALKSTGLVLGGLLITDALVRAFGGGIGRTRVVLTPGQARVGTRTVAAKDLELVVASDAQGPMLVVGDGVVVAADVDPAGLERLLAPLRGQTVRDTERDVLAARQALGRFTTDTSDGAAVGWLEPGRRLAALAAWVVPSLAAIYLWLLWRDDASAAATAALGTALVALTVVVGRVVRMASQAARLGAQDGGQQEAEVHEDALEHASIPADESRRAAGARRAGRPVYQR